MQGREFVPIELVVIGALWLALAFTIFGKIMDKTPQGHWEDPEAALSLVPLLLGCLFAWPLILWIFHRMNKEA